MSDTLEFLRSMNDYERAVHTRYINGAFQFNTDIVGIMKEMKRQGEVKLSSP